MLQVFKLQMTELKIAAAQFSKPLSLHELLVFLYTAHPCVSTM